MKTETKYFGPVEYEQEEVISFPSGLFGFEEEKDFLMLPFAGSQGNLFCFQSLKTPPLAFIAMNPFSLDPTYAPVLTPEELKLMEVETSQGLCYYVLCTVNMKCPVVINDQSRRAVQVILEQSDYTMRHRLGSFPNGGAE